MSRTRDIKVRGQGGLKLEQLKNLLRQEIKYNPEEVIAHVGVNNIEFKARNISLTNLQISVTVFVI